MAITQSLEAETSETGARVNAVSEWRSFLTGVTSALLLYETITGLMIFLLPFSRFNQFSVILHTILGIAMVAPVGWYLTRHWMVRKKGKLNHYQFLGYISLVLLVLCIVSGIILTWQGALATAISYTWDIIHLVTGITVAVFIIVHLATVVIRKVNNPESVKRLKAARRLFYARSAFGCFVAMAICGAWTWIYVPLHADRSFSEDYNWTFGEDQPFAPSLARVDNSGWNNDVQNSVLDILSKDQHDAYLAAFGKQRTEAIGLFTHVKESMKDLSISAEQQKKIDAIFANAAAEMKKSGALNSKLLAGSAGCGSSGCHTQIYEEWLPSAHRYSAIDDMFQKVQEFMANELSPEHTRYCAGCHDPISLFAGAKNEGNITLSSVGANEGSSCIVCHSIVQTDVQGNGDYTIDPPERYAYELVDGPVAKFMSDFLIRTYPDHHVTSFSRPLYKTPEFCAACHKQYIDEIVNTDIGKVQGQNQYDSWKNSRWYHEGDETKTLSCRECHMPLIDSDDPARGDLTDYNRTKADKKHRSHRHLASNQYIPLLHKLEGAIEQTELIEQWLRGEYEIPEIADKWTTGPVIRMEIVGPHEVTEGSDVAMQVILTNNKTGHEFPTGPLDMIESWIELKVEDKDGNVIHHTGGLDETDRVKDSQVLLRADVFDRRGEPIDRHNLWDLVGASYKRTLYPGVTDTVQVEFQCPSMARKRVIDSDTESDGPQKRTEDFTFEVPNDTNLGKLTVTAVLWYRKANPEFLDTVYGIEAGARSPIIEMTRSTTWLKVIPNDEASSE